jgi:predicted transposase YdaD
MVGTGDKKLSCYLVSARQDYRVINLWEVDVKIALEQPLPSLLPFVPILKGGEDESIIRQALRLLQADEQLNQLEKVLAFFAKNFSNI